MGTILTNKYNLPDTIVDACKADSHKVAGDISVTQLLDSPRIRLLKKRHDTVEDVSDRLYMLMGTALHHILERANISSVRKRAFLLVVDTFLEKAKGEEDAKKKEHYIKVAKYLQDIIPVFFPEIGYRYIFEVTLQYDVNGVMVYGTFDLYDQEKKILYDYKFCSVYNWIFPEARNKWIAQTNVYAFLLQKNGYEVKEIRIVAFFRDWNSNNLKTNKDYPDLQIKEIPVQVYPLPQMETFIAERVRIHKEAETGDLPECNGKERWANSDQWAVKLKGGKNAHRLFDVETKAISYTLENCGKYPGMTIDYRPGDSRRCDKYCPVVKHCEQRKKELEKINQ